MPKTFKTWKGDEIKKEDVYRMVGPGWSGILDECFEKLFALGWEGEISQIKEKFGTLRLYLEGLTDEMWDITCAAEHKSSSVCEDCGAPGEVHPGFSWIRTQCHACNEERAKDGRRPHHNERTT